MLSELKRLRVLAREIDSITSQFDWLNARHWPNGKCENYCVLKRKQERRLIALAERSEYLHRLKSAVWSVKQNNPEKENLYG